MLDIQERVSLGASWLDKFYPKWPTKIDLATLDMQDMNLCILGQIYGDLGDGMNKAKQDWTFWLDHGIILPNANESVEAVRKQYRLLTELWKKVTKERL